MKPLEECAFNNNIGRPVHIIIDFDLINSTSMYDSIEFNEFRKKYLENAKGLRTFDLACLTGCDTYRVRVRMLEPVSVQEGLEQMHNFHLAYESREEAFKKYLSQDRIVRGGLGMGSAGFNPDELLFDQSYACMRSHGALKECEKIIRWIDNRPIKAYLCTKIESFDAIMNHAEQVLCIMDGDIKAKNEYCDLKSAWDCALLTMRKTLENKDNWKINGEPNTDGYVTAFFNKGDDVEKYVGRVVEFCIKFWERRSDKQATLWIKKLKAHYTEFCSKNIKCLTKTA